MLFFKASMVHIGPKKLYLLVNDRKSKRYKFLGAYVYLIPALSSVYVIIL